jgi:transposase
MRQDTFVGIDVSKRWLDLASRPAPHQGRLANDAAGIAQLVELLFELKPERVVLEASGGLQGPAVAALAVAGLPVVVVNPRQVRDFARATGRLAKTEALDAKVLAHFAEAVKPEVRPLADAQAQELSAILARRGQVLQMLVAEKNRLGSALPTVRKGVQEHIG